MEQVKGMGDKMDWDTYYLGGTSPLDDVEVEPHTERARSESVTEEKPPPVERSTIERIINSLKNGGNGQDVLSTTEVVTLQPPPRFSGRSLVES